MRYYYIPVSISNLSVGIVNIASIFSCNFNELTILFENYFKIIVVVYPYHPFMPMYNPSAIKFAASSLEPVKECTTPPAFILC